MEDTILPSKIILLLYKCLYLIMQTFASNKLIYNKLYGKFYGNRLSTTWLEVNWTRNLKLLIGKLKNFDVKF